MEEKEFFSTAELPKAVTKETAAVFGGKATAVVKFINVADIMPDPESTPKIYPMEELARFALDILENGLKNPIALVSSSYKSKGIYRILSGEKRFRACLLARIERVPCTIIYPCGSDAERKELMMPPRDYFEEARIYAEAINRGLYTEEDIAENIRGLDLQYRNMLREVYLRSFTIIAAQYHIITNVLSLSSTGPSRVPRQMSIASNCFSVTVSIITLPFSGRYLSTRFFMRATAVPLSASLQ